MRPNAHSRTSEEAKRSSTGRNGRADRPKGGADELGAILDHCTRAQRLAEASGERFLAYLLAMTVEEARGLLSNGPTDEPRSEAS